MDQGERTWILSVFTKGAARENQPPGGVEKSMLIFSKRDSYRKNSCTGEKLRDRCNLDCLAPRAGFEPATRSRLFSSVARVTAVHTFGRLPQAADRAILPLRTPRYSRNRARARHTCPGQGYPEKPASLNLPNNDGGRSRNLPSGIETGFNKNNSNRKNLR